MNNFLRKFISLRVRARRAVDEITQIINDRTHPGLGFAIATATPSAESIRPEASSILRDMFGDGFLLAVPKNRRSVERRLMRKHGFGKLILPKNNLVKCDACGHFYPVHAVCGNCYEKVKKETEEMQEAIMKELKLEQIDKDVIVLYEGDERDTASIEGKRIVELPKKRPPWFSKNILSRDSGTQRNTDSSVGAHQPQPVLKDE